MQSKTNIRQSMAFLKRSIVLVTMAIVTTASPLRAAEVQLVNPRAHNAQTMQMRIRLTGHVRYCMAGKEKTALARKALAIILKHCPKFFATAKMPLLFAYAALEKVDQGANRKKKRAKARRLLKKHKLLSHLHNKRFRKAVLIYVFKEKMMKKMAPYWQEAKKFVLAISESSEHHACAMVMRHLWQVVRKAREQGLSLNGPVDEAMLAKLKKYLPHGTGCPKTGKSEFTIEGTSLRCRHHGTAAEAQKHQGPFSPDDLVAQVKSNPILWAFDHVVRSSRANALLANLRVKKGLGRTVRPEVALVSSLCS